jgi:hypothetical protein
MLILAAAQPGHQKYGKRRSAQSSGNSIHSIFSETVAGMSKVFSMR